MEIVTLGHLASLYDPTKVFVGDKFNADTRQRRRMRLYCFRVRVVHFRAPKFRAHNFVLLYSQIGLTLIEMSEHSDTVKAVELRQALLEINQREYDWFFGGMRNRVNYKDPKARLREESGSICGSMNVC